MKEAGVAPPGLKPIQKPMNEPRTKVRQYRGSIFQVSRTIRRFIPVRALRNDSPSSTVRRISPMPNRPMTATMKSKPFMRSTKPNVILAAVGLDIVTGRGEDEAEQDRDERLDRISPAES